MRNVLRPSAVRDKDFGTGRRAGRFRARRDPHSGLGIRSRFLPPEGCNQTTLPRRGKRAGQEREAEHHSFPLPTGWQ